jgi:ubiquinone/menaquinone biosynthesis C-methylase UbiE
LKKNHNRKSATDNEGHIELFNKIASVYRLFYRSQVRSYSKLLQMKRHLLAIHDRGRILDIGCGTGALAYSLKMMDFDVIGIDASSAMIEHARRANRLAGITFMVSDVSRGLNFESKSFDLVIGSYLAHGLKERDRITLFKESKRLAKEQVIFHDFNQKRSIFIDFIEWLEGSDYFNFIYKGYHEMEKIFSSVRIINMGQFVSWYLCKP